MTWTYVSTAGCAISGIAAAIEFAKNNKNAGATSAIVNGQATFIYQHHSLTGAYVFTAAASAFLISTFVSFGEALFHRHKAIDLYNQQYE